jgi:SET domain-containing protein
VRTRIAQSPIHGIGLFADEPISAGTVIWAYSPKFDLSFNPEDLDSLAPPARDLISKYAYFEAAVDAFVLCGDDARFMNHSDSPNTSEVAGPRTIAARDIAAGEELTCDYAELGLPRFP